tara:strand:+ start:1674 stop:2210 length:537 start_codon:yes stop_codon:yes gene_type:complete
LLSESTQQTQQEETSEPEGAPETYDFKSPEGLPEGAEIDKQILDTYSEAARELNLPQDQAQKMLDKVMPKLHERGLEEQERQRNEWAKESKADPEFGGDNLDENLGIAKKAIEQFGSEGLRDLLDSSTGLGNHPELIRFMVGVGKALSEDRFVGSSQGQSVDPNDDAAQARRLYPSSK